MFTFPRSVALILLVFVSAAAFAASASPEEVEKQNAFKKSYGSQVTNDRLAALANLEGCTHTSTWQLLYTVATVDAAKEVRIDAFKKLAAMPARNPGLAKMLAMAFNATRMKDEKDTSEIKQAFAEAMEKVEFKFDIGNAMTDYFHKNLRYPDILIAANSSPKQAQNAREFAERQRTELEQFLTAYNKLFSTDVKEPDKNTPANIRKWWTANAIKVAQADKELMLKYSEEDKEAAKAAKEAK
jgi:hypothetical protein